MAISDKELADRQARVEKLREQVAQEEAKRLSRQSDAANDLLAVQLDAEEARLQAQLAEAKDANKVAAVKGGVEAPLEAAKAELANANAIAQAREQARQAREEEAAKAKSAAANESKGE